MKCASHCSISYMNEVKDGRIITAIGITYLPSSQQTLRLKDSLMTRIPLQNTPALKGVTTRPVRFTSNGTTLAGVLCSPDGQRGAWTTVNVQMAGTNARELTARAAANTVADFLNA